MEKKKKTTLRDIAERCGCSVPTVSEILRGKTRNYSSGATRKLVMETAETLGYQSNIGYQLMHGIPTNTVAVTMGSMNLREDEYIQELLLLLLEKLSGKGYSVLVSPPAEDPSKRADAVLDLIRRGAEHLISLSLPCAPEDWESILEKTGITAIAFTPRAKHAVRLDVQSGILRLLESFQERGCRKIRSAIVPEYDRLNALSIFHGLPEERLTEVSHFFSLGVFDTRRNHYVELAGELGFDATRGILEKEPDTDAIFYHSDYFALGGLKYILQTGRVPGKDIHLAGFNNTRAVQACHFPISSAAQNVGEIADLLVEHFKENQKKSYIVKPSVFLR